MKGVSAIIAVILILMIVVALAALAYTWFSGIFTTLTTSASNATSSVTTAMGMQIRIEAAKFYAGTTPCGANNCWVNATIRNTGTSDVNIGRLGAYIGSRLQSSIIPTSGTLSPGSTVTLNITNTTAACPNVVLTITTESGLSDYRTITC